MGLASPPETRSPTAALGLELLGKGAGMKGLPDFKGNSQNFESGDELGARAFRAGSRPGRLGRKRRPPGASDPGGVETPRDLQRRLSQLSGVCDGGLRTLPGFTSL